MNTTIEGDLSSDKGPVTLLRSNVKGTYTVNQYTCDILSGTTVNNVIMKDVPPSITQQHGSVRMTARASGNSQVYQSGGNMTIGGHSSRRGSRIYQSLGDLTIDGEEQTPPQKQTLTIERGAEVKGKVTFENGDGRVIVKRGGEFSGNIEGGTVVRE